MTISTVKRNTSRLFISIFNIFYLALREEELPDELFHNFGTFNQSCDVSELHIICRSTDFEALKLLRARRVIVLKVWVCYGRI